VTPNRLQTKFLLIATVDHPGVSNMQLVKEKDPMATAYDNQSVAEQNSVSIAFEVLMRSEYSDLRACLFSDHNELRRFRQLVVNSVMATDIFDPELKRMRDQRWEKAFHAGVDTCDTSALDFNRKATIIIEHLIQASDVSHTMQHWHIYRKWNARLFDEMYVAFKGGRSPTNPADGWYKGELWFFDNYVVRS
jgi:3'5'-cyclic nucleotide phosphodiesterase